MVNITPKIQCSMPIAALSIFGAKNKNRANWCAKQSSGISRKKANLKFLNLHF